MRIHQLNPLTIVDFRLPIGMKRTFELVGVGRAEWNPE